MWRPDDWFNPCFDEDSGGRKRASEGWGEYEDGADDMLKSLEPLIRRTAPFSKLINILYGESYSVYIGEAPQGIVWEQEEK